MNANPNPEGQRDNGQGHEHQPFAAPNNMDLGSMPLDPSASPMVTHFNGTPATGSAAVQRAEEEAHGVAAAENGHRAIDRFAQEQIDRKFSFAEKVLTDRSMYRAVQKVRMELLNSSTEYRLQFYRTLMDARLEALRERCNSGVAMLKGLYREQVASFLMSQMEKLAKEADQRQRNFIEMMKSKHQYADSLKAFPTTQAKYQKSILDEEGRYLQVIDNLLIRFEAIVTEQFQKQH